VEDVERDGQNQRGHGGFGALVVEADVGTAGGESDVPVLRGSSGIYADAKSREIV
jgi:hypothetical protein